MSNLSVKPTLDPDPATFLRWVADSYRAHAKTSDIPDEIDGYEGSAVMALNAAKQVDALRAALSCLQEPGEPVGEQWEHTDPTTGRPVWLEKRYWNGTRSEESRKLYTHPPTRDSVAGWQDKVISSLRNCVHDGGYDRENGPIGCHLGDKCVCIGVANTVRAISNREG